MQCDSCHNEAVISQQYSGRHLCYRHLAADLEAKAKRSIRAHHWLVSGDHIGVIVTGDKRSGALLQFLKRLTENRRDIRLSVILAEGFPAIRDTNSTARQIAGCCGVACRESGPEDSSALLLAENRNGRSAEAMLKGLCGIATPTDLTKIALTTSLEDVASRTLAAFLGCSLEALPKALSEGSCRIPVICPFSAIPAAELELYWEGLGYDVVCRESPRDHDGFYHRVRKVLDDYNTRHPATFHALLNLGEQLTGGKEVMFAGDSVSKGFYPVSRLSRQAEENGA